MQMHGRINGSQLSMNGRELPPELLCRLNLSSVFSLSHEKL
jgi:hypothetical protein